MEPVRKQNFFKRFILSHLTLSQQQTTLQTKYAYKSICGNCKESFSTLKLLEDYTEAKHPDHYAKAPNTTMQLKQGPSIHA